MFLYQSEQLLFNEMHIKTAGTCILCNRVTLSIYALFPFFSSSHHLKNFMWSWKNKQHKKQATRRRSTHTEHFLVWSLVFPSACFFNYVIPTPPSNHFSFMRRFFYKSYYTRQYTFICIKHLQTHNFLCDLYKMVTTVKYLYTNTLPP